MTEQMKVFLLALAELLEKHDIDTIEAVDDGADYYQKVDGVEFQMWSRFDSSGNEVRAKCVARTQKAFNAEDVRQLVTPNGHS